jgi:hypothetical protein
MPKLFDYLVLRIVAHRNSSIRTAFAIAAQNIVRIRCKGQCFGWRIPINSNSSNRGSVFGFQWQI